MTRADEVDGLRREPLSEVAVLRGQVTAHLERVRATASQTAFVDVAVAERVAEACLGLLDGWGDLDDEQRHWVQAACLYFAQPGDMEDDFTSLVGFDDDLEVVNLALAHLGLERLQGP